MGTMLFPATLALTGLGASTLTLPVSDVQTMILDAASTYGVPPELALGVAAHESGFDPNATHLNANGTTDWGVMQLNDSTVASLGVSNPLDAQQNIDAGVSLLAKYLQQYNGDEQKALWAYASGPGAVASGNMNSTASQFVSYVQSYTPTVDIGLADGSIPAPSSDLSSIESSVSGWLESGGDVTLAGVSLPVIGLGLAAGLVALFVWTMSGP